MPREGFEGRVRGQQIAEEVDGVARGLPGQLGAGGTLSKEISLQQRVLPEFSATRPDKQRVDARAPGLQLLKGEDRANDLEFWPQR